MSLLLQALRKSEQRRQNGQPPPLGLPTGADAGERRPPPSRGLPGMLVLVLAVLIAVAVWWALGMPGWADRPQSSAIPGASLATDAVAETQGDREEGAPVEEESEQTLQIAAYQRPTPPSAESEPDDLQASTRPPEGRIDAEPSAPSRSSAETMVDPEVALIDEAMREPGLRPADFRREPSGTGPASATPQANASTGDATVDANVEAPVRRETAVPPTRPASRPPATTPASEPSAEADPRANTIDPWELPASLRSEFPGVEISVHVFAPDRSARFVLIEGERYGEGDTVADGVRLTEIHRGGVIVEFREYRIWIE